MNTTSVIKRTRPRIDAHLHVGLRVLRTSDCTVWTIRQCWRADRTALLVAHNGGERRLVSFTELCRRHEIIQPFAEGAR